MEIGLIGLGKMGYPLALNMKDNGHRVVAFSRSPEKAAELSAVGLEGTSELENLTSSLTGRKLIWLMVPAGKAVDQVIKKLVHFLDKGDIIVDGGNSNYHDSVRRFSDLQEKGIDYVDAGISGGPSGARSGACIMIGAEENTYYYLEPLLKDLCVQGGCLRVGGSGAGHYVKMVHNGIEYGMMQAIAEGFELMEHSPYEIDFQRLAKLWNRGSVIRSWLIELTANVFAEDPKLEKIKGVVGSSGTGLWTVEEALLRQVPVPAIAQALFARYSSENYNAFSARLLAGLRREFGGHDVENA